VLVHHRHGPELRNARGGLTLVKLDIISHSTLIKSRRYFVVINLVVCSFITPDFISTFFMIIPMQVLSRFASSSPPTAASKKKGRSSPDGDAGTA